MKEKFNEQPAVDLNNVNHESEAYLNAMRTLEKEKADAKKAKKKAKRKKRLKTFGIIVAAFIAFCVLSPTIFSASAKRNISKYISDPEDSVVSLEQLVADYTEYEESEEKEMKTLFKLGKKAISKGEYGTAAYLLKACSDYSDEYNAEIAEEIFGIDADEVEIEKAGGYASLVKLNADNGNVTDEKTSETILKLARQIAESADYETAAALYSVYTGKENITDELKDARYNLAISYVENKEYLKVYDYLKELGDYKYSKALYLWVSVTSNKDFDCTSSARRELKSRLKDPSSYQEQSASYGSYVYIDTAKAGNLTVNIKRHATIEYSATNSFGGRLSDSYYWTTEGPSWSAEGFERKELENLLDMSLNEVVEKAKSFN